MTEIISLDNLDPATLVFSDPEEDFAGKDVFYRINVERRLEDGTTVPLYIHGIETKSTDEWCFAKMNVFEKDKRKNHSLQVAFQSKFQPQTLWLENYKLKIVDSLTKNLLSVRDAVDYPLLEEKYLEEKNYSHVANKNITFKLLEQGGNVETPFEQYDEATKKRKPIEAKVLERQKFKMKFIVLVEGIFVSSTALSIQAKIVEALVITKTMKLSGRHIEV
jgi:hypothetical protein